MSLQQPNITLNIITQGGFISLPPRQWSDGVYVVGFRSVVITLTKGARAPQGVISTARTVRLTPARGAGVAMDQDAGRRQHYRRGLGRRLWVQQRLPERALCRQRVPDYPEHDRLWHRVRHQGTPDRRRCRTRPPWRSLSRRCAATWTGLRPARFT